MCFLLKTKEIYILNGLFVHNGFMWHCDICMNNFLCLWVGLASEGQYKFSVILIIIEIIKIFLLIFVITIKILLLTVISKFKREISIIK